MTKRTEDMTVAETMDAIFGDGFTEKISTPEELEIARQPYKLVCESPFVSPEPEQDGEPDEKSTFYVS